MVGFTNPFYPGPGQPQAWNYWNGNQFMMPPLPQPQPPPPPPLAPTVTPQDVQAMQATQAMGSPSGGGDSGGLLGGATRDQGFADPSRGVAYGGAPSGKSNPDYGSIGSWAGTLGGLFAGPAGMALGPAGNMIGNAVDVSRNNSMINAASQQFGTPISNLGFGDWARGVLNDTLPGRAFGLGRDPYMAAFGNIADAKGRLGAQEAAAAEQAAAADKTAKQDMWGYDGMLSGSPNKTGDMLGPGYANGVYGGSMDKGGPTAGGQQGIDPTGPGGFGSPGPGPDAGGFGPGAGAGPGAGGAFGPGFAKGGKVRPPAAGLLDPSGPDDQFAGLQTGEGVLTKAAMKRHPGLLDALNKGNVKKARGLLGG